ncbi:MAG: hypothetical protein J5610_03120 [Prevotella sp.]|nr:hypothetical protein [Prevotella sp.]
MRKAYIRPILTVEHEIEIGSLLQGSGVTGLDGFGGMGTDNGGQGQDNDDADAKSSGVLNLWED